MDSLTQVVLGAGVGEVILGRKVGNKAMLWGGIAGTIPDLDVLGAPFLTDLQEISFHRGFSHSILFAVMFAPILGFLIYSLYKKKEAKWWEWALLCFGSIFTHPLLDCFTTFGTQVFLPFSDYRVAFNSIFVIDPLYTVPFILLLLICLFLDRKSAVRKKIGRYALYLSTAYLLFTAVNKLWINHQFERSLERQGIAYDRMMSTPTPLNNILWMGVAEGKDFYYIGFYSWFDDTPEIHFFKEHKNHNWVERWHNTYAMQQLNWFSNGYYSITKADKDLVYNDLRYGKTNGLWSNKQDYVFSYNLLQKANGSLDIEKRESPLSLNKKNFERLYQRIKGKQ